MSLYKKRILCTYVSRRQLSNNIRKFNEIPGPLSLPLIGTLYQYLPIIGEYIL